MSATTALPTWDMTPYFPSLESPEFATAFEEATLATDRLTERFDALGIDGGEPLAVDAEVAGQAGELLTAQNGLEERWRVVRAFVYSYVSTDSRNEAAASWLSQMARPMTSLSKLATRYTAWVGRLDVEALIGHGGVAAEHSYFLRRAKVQAEHQLSPREEELAADLYDTGGGAWSRLHRNVGSQISVPFRGGQATISELRSYAYDADADLRREAYHAELDAWKANETVLAAAMNSIKGESGRLAKKRGWDSLLDEALFDNGTDRETLEAMLSACRDAYPVLRRYLRAKAKALGHPGGLPWYDLFAPVGDGREWGWDEAERFVAEKFDTFEPGLGELARRASRERWTDAGARPGKGDGAFCMGTRGDESRILMNYKPAFGSVSTLAHELGHAYHNLCLDGRTAAQRETPMTFAETASIFCETVIKRAALAEVGAEERVSILEAALQGSCQVVVDIGSRFQFEREVAERREDRELSGRELCETMLTAQRETYGDGLDGDLLHPYMWAAKPHYYSSRAFYNYPYTFGLLFGLGLFAVYQREPAGFVERYRDLLSRTGMEDGHALTREFGIDLRDKGFWAGSLSVIADDVSAFESAVA